MITKDHLFKILMIKTHHLKRNLKVILCTIDKPDFFDQWY